MANLIEVDEQLAESLDERTGKSSGHLYDGAKARLYKSNTTITKSTVLSDLTEADFAGYASITLANATFASASVSGHVASSLYGTTLTWTRSTTGTAQTVYGMYITNAAGTKIIAAGPFDGGPYTVTNSGDAINETLTVRYSSEF